MVTLKNILNRFLDWLVDYDASAVKPMKMIVDGTRSRRRPSLLDPVTENGESRKSPEHLAFLIRLRKKREFERKAFPERDVEKEIALEQKRRDRLLMGCLQNAASAFPSQFSKAA